MSKEIAKGKYAGEGELPEAPARLPRASDPGVVRPDGTLDREKLLTAIGGQATGMIDKLLLEREGYQLALRRIEILTRNRQAAIWHELHNLAADALKPVE